MEESFKRLGQSISEHQKRTAADAKEKEALEEAARKIEEDRRRPIDGERLLFALEAQKVLHRACLELRDGGATVIHSASPLKAPEAGVDVARYNVYLDGKLYRWLSFMQLYVVAAAPNVMVSIDIGFAYGVSDDVAKEVVAATATHRRDGIVYRRFKTFTPVEEIVRERHIRSALFDMVTECVPKD